MSKLYDQVTTEHKVLRGKGGFHDCININKVISTYALHDQVNINIITSTLLDYYMLSF